MCVAPGPARLGAGLAGHIMVSIATEVAACKVLIATYKRLQQ